MFLTECHNESPSSSLRSKVYTLECCNLCAACTVSCEGLLWRDTWTRNLLPQNGIIQGCPLSMLLLNLLKNTWARSVKAVTTTAMPKAYADDAGALNKNSENIDIALKITGRFATVTQQKLNVDKTKVWGTTLNLNGEQLDVVCKLKSLGIQLKFARRMTNDVTERRVKKGITFSKRIRWAPLPLQTKASLIACLVEPTAMYGFPAGGVALKLVSSLRTAAVAALWCTKRKLC